MYIDIHTHQLPPEGTAGILNLLRPELPEPAPGLYSMGIHPAFADVLHWEKQLETLYTNCTDSRVIAIGETGLDTACATPFSLQETVFTAQIRLAAATGKPLIIHCVKAWEPLLSLLQKENPAVPVIFHGYRKNKELAQRILRQGYYISLGKALQYPQVQELIPVIPPDKLFLETDDSAIFIGEIYRLAASASGIDLNSLVLQIQQNTRQVFGPAFNI